MSDDLDAGPDVLERLADERERRRAAEHALAHDATHDRLTGLPNRAHLWERLAAMLARPASKLVVLALDLDDFRLVNDSLGHDAGDELLLTVAGRLSSTIRPGDLVARAGADEFTVVCADVSDAESAVDIAERLLGAIGAPCVVAGGEVALTAGIGFVLWPVTTAGGPVEREHGGADPAVLLRDADVALHQAKAAGPASIAAFDEQAREAARARLIEATALRRAVDAATPGQIRRGPQRSDVYLDLDVGSGLSLHYQPIVDLGTGQPVAVEALARWLAPFGQVPPTRFVPLAEDLGLIDRLGSWVLRTALAQLASWRNELGERAPAHVSVNLSPRQLGRRHLVDDVLLAVRDHGLRPADLCLELTESVFMEDIDRAAGVLAELRSFGVRIALDDFGTGYSSLASLRRFPGDYLKIDRSFITGLRSTTTGAAIVASVVDLAGAVGLASVAEGIETAADADLLRRLGCPFAQGYLWARPMAGAAFAEWLGDVRDRRCLSP